MIKFKWGVITGSIALVLSLMLGIVSDVRPSFIFLRALIFTVVFFGFGIGLSFLINNFFPELLVKHEEPSAQEEQPGSRVNITLGNTGEYALPEMYKSSDGSQHLGNIEDLISGKFKSRSYGGSAKDRESSFQPGGSGGIDRKSEDVYNGSGSAFKQDGFNFMEMQSSAGLNGADASSGGGSAKPVFTPMFSDESEGLLDLDSMSTAFGGSAAEPSRFAFSGSSDGGGELLQKQSFDEAVTPAKSKPKDDKFVLEGDFKPKELAEGIRTILNKDN